MEGRHLATFFYLSKIFNLCSKWEMRIVFPRYNVILFFCQGCRFLGQRPSLSFLSKTGWWRYVFLGFKKGQISNTLEQFYAKQCGIGYDNSKDCL